MKKISKILIVTVISVFGLMATTKAAVGTPYTVTVTDGQSTYMQSRIYPGEDYTYSVNEITDYAGSAKVYTTIQTLYNGSYVTISPTLSLSRTGSAVWRPSSVSSNPVGFTVRTSGTCSGSNTSSTACAVDGATYRLKLQNKSSFYDFTINGQFWFAK